MITVGLLLLAVAAWVPMHRASRRPGWGKVCLLPLEHAALRFRRIMDGLAATFAIAAAHAGRSAAQFAEVVRMFESRCP